MENSIEALQKTKTRTAVSSSNTTPRNIPKESKPGYSKCTYTPMFIVALFTIAELQNHPR
jgi:hypothetical protein